MGKPVRGLFVTGTNTGVGKTCVAALIARELSNAGHRVGVYKPVASGCRVEHGELVAEDAIELGRAAGLSNHAPLVCPQRFLAPLAPPRAAAAEGKHVDSKLLRTGLDYWLDSSDVVVIEGVGGWFSPLTESEFVADLARDFAFPVVVVSHDALGTISNTLLTLMAVKAYGLPVAGVVLNESAPVAGDLSIETNRDDIARHTDVPVLAKVFHQGNKFDEPVDWISLAAPQRMGTA